MGVVNQCPYIDSGKFGTYAGARIATARNKQVLNSSSGGRAATAVGAGQQSLWGQGGHSSNSCGGGATAAAAAGAGPQRQQLRGQGGLSSSSCGGGAATAAAGRPQQLRGGHSSSSCGGRVATVVPTVALGAD